MKKTIIGITINNDEIHVDKEFKKKIRAGIFNSIVNKDYSKKEEIIGRIVYVNSIEEVYKEKICSYIIRVTEKGQLKNDVDIVNAYNQKKFFEPLPDMR